MLTPLAWLKETDTVATHAQAKRDITHSAGYTVHVYPISLNYNTSSQYRSNSEAIKQRTLRNHIPLNFFFSEKQPQFCDGGIAEVVIQSSHFVVGPAANCNRKFLFANNLGFVSRLHTKRPKRFGHVNIAKYILSSYGHFWYPGTWSLIFPLSSINKIQATRIKIRESIVDMEAWKFKMGQVIRCGCYCELRGSAPPHY